MENRTRRDMRSMEIKSDNSVSKRCWKSIIFHEAFPLTTCNAYEIIGNAISES